MKQHGFTLLELLVVMAIMAVATAAVPYLGRSLLDRVRLTFAVRGVSAAIYGAEGRALSQGQVVALDIPALERLTAAAVRLQGDGGAQLPGLLFYPDRSATPAVITLTRGTQHRALAIDALIGQVVVHD